MPHGHEDPYVCTLSEKLQEKAARELNETAESRERCFREIIERTKSRPDIRFRCDEAFLLRFLRARKFDVDRAFKNLVRYYEVRKEYPAVFDDLTVSSVRHVLDMKMNITLPPECRDRDGNRVGILRFGSWEPRVCSYGDTVKLSVISSEKLLEDEEIQINGITAILDFGNLGMRHSAYILPSNAKMMMSILQSVLPTRYNTMHYVNLPPVFEQGMVIYRQFMSEKMKQRTKLHTGKAWKDSIKDFFPASCLPSDYGGSCPSFDEMCSSFNNQLLDWEDDFLRQQKNFGLVKKKDILGSKKCSENDGGLAGTFKKLEM
ncbi:alpha-tocopherol transfer protein-like [Ptychodera flava]|uniref:alpha-tocopherol transfer protein-like n=1 Tax=Ptychodera flava TaxID=63121 RepID=UPI00396A930F